MYYSGNPAAKIWRRIMEDIHNGLPIVQFSDPANRGYDTGIFGKLEVTPTPTAVPTPTPSPTPTATPKATPTPEPIPVMPVEPEPGEEIEAPEITIVVPVG